MARMTETERKRFDSKCKAGENGCVTYHGGYDKDGYGVFHFRRKNRRAHRVAFWDTRGDIPKGMVIDHACRTRNCVNPEHLRIMTAQAHRRLLRGSTCKRGHKFDREYGGQQYCSICEREKTKRLRKKWNEEDTTAC